MLATTLICLVRVRHWRQSQGGRRLGEERRGEEREGAAYCCSWVRVKSMEVLMLCPLPYSTHPLLLHTCARETFRNEEKNEAIK